MVCADDHLAAQAGVAMLKSGGTAADAAVAAGAVLAVTCQHMCGMGGDLFALVHRPTDKGPAVLNASGRSGSGADPTGLRSQGHRRVPPSGDIRAVPVPGCVDGWLELHDRFGRLSLGQVLEPAEDYAVNGFPASTLLSQAVPAVVGVPGGGDFAGAIRPGATVRRPGAARALRAIVEDGREGFYLGDFGKGLVALGRGEYSTSDLEEPNADWVTPLRLHAWGHDIWTAPPNSQGYLTLASMWMAERVHLPDDPEDPAWAHLTVEAARQAAYDRLGVLHEHADGHGLLAEDRLGPRLREIRTDRAALLGDRFRPGGTSFLCAVDGQRMGVSLIQSNATGFGVGIAEPSTGVFLHNRGVGFNLVDGHPAEYGPRRRPPHTLSPALVTDPSGRLTMVIGTMGGDSQPQILLQLLTRMLRHGEGAGDSIAAPRWALEGPGGAGGFGTWWEGGRVVVSLETGAPGTWAEGLRRRGHTVQVGRANHGRAQVIVSHGDRLEGASDPRSPDGGASGY